MKKFVYVLPFVLLLALAACGPAPTPDPAVLTATAVAALPEATAVPPTAVPAQSAAPEVPTDTGPVNTATEITFNLLETSDGVGPELGDWVVLHLVGYLEDGTLLFDTYEQDSPIVYPYGDEFMLEGVNHAVGQMKIGDKANVIIPPALALGAEGGGVIPPNATLIFDMELISIPQVEVTELEAGTGDFPEQGDTLVVHYVGTLEDDTEFDSSYGRNQPFEFVLGAGQVIPGWEMGMAQIRPGGKARLVVPPELGYGNQELPGIPANSTLIFEVELLEVK